MKKSLVVFCEGNWKHFAAKSEFWLPELFFKGAFTFSLNLLNQKDKCARTATHANDTFNAKKNCFLPDRLEMTGFLCPHQLSPFYFPHGLQNSILAFPLFSEVKTDHISKTKDFQEAAVAVRVRSVQMNKSVFCKSWTMLYCESALQVFVSFLPLPQPENSMKYTQDGC